VGELRKALAGLEEREARAWCFAYLAVAATGAGQREPAQKFLEEARRLGPADHPALLRAARALRSDLPTSP
jgi:hypothetical protein